MVKSVKVQKTAPILVEAGQMNSEPASSVSGKASSTSGPSLQVSSSLNLQGNAHSEVVFIIEGNAYDGKAGQLLQKMIQAMGVRYTSVLMISIAEGASASAIAEVAPHLAKAKITVTLGEGLTHKILNRSEPLAQLRSKLHPFLNTQLIASFHPSQLLAEPALKKDAWEDLKLAVKELGWTLPNRGV